MANDVYANTLFLNKGQCSTLWPWQTFMSQKDLNEYYAPIAKKIESYCFFHCHIKTSVYFWHSYKPGTSVTVL